MVVEIRPEDLQNDELRMKNEELGFADDTDSVLSMMHFQEALEAACWQQETCGKQLRHNGWLTLPEKS